LTWEDTWKDVLRPGGNKRWKDSEGEHVAAVMAEVQKRYASRSVAVLVPLCGDTPVVPTLWQQGHHVTGMELVPQALESMRSQFPGSWSSGTEGNFTVWKHESGRAELWQGDIAHAAPSLVERHDVVVDKDSWGALPKDFLPTYTQRVASYMKPGGVIILEAKFKDNAEQRRIGPPFHTEPEDLRKSWNPNGVSFITTLGERYRLKRAGLHQIQYLLQRARSRI